MNDVSVLLNLTGKFVFEKANPLMDIVSGHGPYLFYDQLSLERFPMDQEEQESHIQKQLVGLRNLLSSRRLSAEDQGGKIRIVVTLDLVGGFGHPQGQEICFPAQKVSRFLELMNCAFEKEPQLLSRMRYTFLFIEWDSDDHSQADFYHALAYDGCYGQPDAWMSREMMVANSARDQMIQNLRSPSVDMLLDDASIRYQYSIFQQKLNELIDRVAEMLKKAHVDQPFLSRVSASIKKQKTIGDICNFDFNHLIKTAISEHIGLCSSEFCNCSFFIVKMQMATITHRKKGEMVLCSLLQLLGTIPNPWAVRLSVVDANMNEHALNANALSQLKREVSAVLPKLKEGGELRWKATDHVSYIEYSSRNTESTDSNPHHEKNEKDSERREQLRREFDRLRQVPFFFGNNPFDWEWYNSVSSILNEICDFEEEHDRPRYVSPGRITEKEMKQDVKVVTYADLEEELKKQKTIRADLTDAGERKSGGNLLTDLNDYLSQRKKTMSEFAEQKKLLKPEMTKLGFASIAYRLCIVASLIITLCYAFHFVFTGNWAESVWTGGCLAVAALICGLAAYVAQRRIKVVIRDIFTKIDGCLHKLQKQREDYLANINSRVRAQNNADIRRKNLDEMEGKLDLFRRHNMQVGIWEKYFALLDDKLFDMLQLIGIIAAQKSTDTESNHGELSIEEMPNLPESICSRFRSMQTTQPQGGDFNNVTCFLNSLNIAIINS